jgi:hypothetical protein
MSSSDSDSSAESDDSSEASDSDDETLSDEAAGTDTTDSTVSSESDDETSSSDSSALSDATVTQLSEFEKLLDDEVTLAIDTPSVPHLSPSRGSFANADPQSLSPPPPTDQEGYVISPANPAFFIPLKGDRPPWFLFRYPLITLSYSTHPRQLEFLLPSTIVTISANMLILNENGRLLTFKIHLHRKQIHKVMALSGKSPILDYLECSEIIGNAIVPDPVNWHYFVHSIFTAELLFACAFIPTRPDPATMASWANAAETDFQKLFDRLIRWSLSRVSKLRAFLPPESFLFGACAAVLRADSKFRSLALQVLAAPGHMKSTFLAKFAEAKLGGFTMLLLFVVKKVQLSLFNAFKLGPVLVRAGIAQIAEGKPVDQNLLEFAGERTSFFDRFGAFPARLKSPTMTTSHIEAFSRVFDFAYKYKDDLRQGIQEILRQ